MVLVTSSRHHADGPSPYPETVVNQPAFLVHRVKEDGTVYVTSPLSPL